MFNNITYKRKFYSIIVIFILLLLVSYKKTYKHIIAAKKQLGLIEQKLQTVEDLNNQIFIYQNEIKIIDNIIGGQTENPERVQRLILDFVSNPKYKINIYSINDTHIFNDKEFTIFTNSIELQGEYNDLAKLLYNIERTFNYSMVISSKFYTVQNYRNNKKNLYLKLILQNYEKNS